MERLPITPLPKPHETRVPNIGRRWILRAQGQPGHGSAEQMHVQPIGLPQTEQQQEHRAPAQHTIFEQPTKQSSALF